MLLFGLFAAGTIVVAIWAAASIVGIVEAPPIVVAAGIVAFVVVLVGALAVAGALRRMAQPLDALIEASGRIEAGDYTTRVPVTGGGEMRSMARAFNQMSAQLQASEERRRAFLADVTHELRTPLTVIGGQLEAIEDGIYKADPERMAALLTQVRQMSGLIEDLHTISLAEVGALQLDPAAVDLNAAADEAVTGFAPAAELQSVALHAEFADGPVIVSLDTVATRRVLANLVSNALRHTPPGGSVTLAVRGEVSAGYIEVTDTGSGMDAELTARAFERFEKGTDSDGSGLGLAIARDLMAAQGGTIELDSSLGAGTRVRLGFALPEG